jgi:hypothetical protein
LRLLLYFVIIFLNTVKMSTMKIAMETQKLHNNHPPSQGMASYFWLFSPSQWSFLDFSNWSSSCWPSIKEDMKKKRFFNILYSFRDDPSVTTEFYNAVTNLLAKKKIVSIDDPLLPNIYFSIYFIDLIRSTWRLVLPVY